MASLMDLYGGPMLEGGPDYDPWSMQAARYRRRYPTRLPDPRALAASRGAVGFSDLPGFDQARQQAFNVYAGEDYNPSSLVQMAMGAVGAPAMVGGVPAGALGSGVGRGIRAYHGSPYDFERFDLKKIGTGEGAQAYGHGLYFAENPNVAQSYKDAMRVQDMDWFVKGTDYRLPAWVARSAQTPRGLDEVRANFINRVRENKEALAAGDHNAADRVYHTQRIVDALDAVKGGAEIGKPGRMYEVNIRAEPQQFLDWDKPLAGQGEAIRSAVPPLVKTQAEAYNRALGATDKKRADELWAMVKDPLQQPGEMFYRDLERHYGRGSMTAGQPVASELLREAGIPGIRYLDQGSRGSGQGTSNYVLFRDDIIDIVKKYGWAGLAAFGISEEQAKEAGVDKPKTRIGNKSYEM